MDLPPPSVLAQLPRPLRGLNGKTQIGEVYSLTDTAKRKRYEVIVAVDGEAVNIYNVQSSKLVTSYAIPPQSSFLCRPCSIRHKLVSVAAIRRQTYCAVARPEPQIKGFFEETQTIATHPPLLTSSSFSLEDSKSPTVFIGITPSNPESSASESFDVLTVHKDGLIRRLAPDLKSQRWKIHHSETASISSDYEVCAGFTVEFNDVTKSLFKRRQDLVALALGDALGVGIEKFSALLLVLRPLASERISLENIKVQIFSVPPASGSDGFRIDENQCLRHLATITLPQLDTQSELGEKNLQWSFHSGSANLSVSYEHGFVSIDLSQYSPTITSQFLLYNEKFSSIMHISSHSVLAAGKSTVALYDTLYNSIQHSIAIHRIPDMAPTRDSSEAPISFISFFAKLGIAVGFKGNSLLAFDLGSLHSTSGSISKRKRDGFLIDAIGRGIASSVTWDYTSQQQRNDCMRSLGLVSEEDAEQWSSFAKDLETITTSKDTKAFDMAVKSYFGSLDKDLGQPLTDKCLNQEKILFVMSKIFSVGNRHQDEPKEVSTSPPSLTVALWPNSTCEWLMNLRQLTASNIEIALRRTAKPLILLPLPAGSLVRALVEYDTSLKALTLLLKSPTLLGFDELTYSVRLCLDVVRTCSFTLDQPVVSASVNIPSRNQENMRERDETADSQDPSPSVAALLQNAFTALNFSLVKLHSHATPAIVSSFRSILSSTEIFSLIHHLRLSLATGGYASRLTEHPPIPIDAVKEAPPLPLNTIIELLNTCVDAIGPSGWISTGVFADMPANDQDVIVAMRAEVSAVLAGIEEAAYLEGILTEFIRYSNALASSTPTAAANNVVSAQRVKREKLNGAELISFTPISPEDGHGDSSGKILPLSLQAAGLPGEHAGIGADISKTKVKVSTGEVKMRSSREIGHLRRKAVGKYSFERLIV